MEVVLLVALFLNFVLLAVSVYQNWRMMRDGLQVHVETPPPMTEGPPAPPALRKPRTMFSEPIQERINSISDEITRNENGGS